MSIARAFTTRRAKQSLKSDVPDGMQRGNGATGSIRHKISAPVELIHTTNMLSYNAPDIYPKTASSNGSSHRSDDELSDSAPTTASTPPTSPDVESPPKRSLLPESKQPNHLSQYFTLPELKPKPSSEAVAPVVPQRAVSHTKKSYDSLVGRQRSNSRMSEQSQRSLSTKGSFTFSRSSSSSTSTTATSQSSTPPQHKAKASGSLVPSTQPTSQPQTSHRKDFSQAQHPFGPELAQVSEIAEEYGVKEKVNDIDAEEQELAAKGLHKFSADVYLGEIQALFSNLFTEAKPMTSAMWI